MNVNCLRQKRMETEEAQQMAKLLYTLLFGFFAGALGMILKQENLLYNTGFLDGYTLGPIKYLEPDTGKLLVTVVMQRIGVAVLLVILSTTYLGSVAAYLYQLWSGLAAGVLAAGSVIRYGIKGILLVAGSLLPQQLILIPAFFAAVYEMLRTVQDHVFPGHFRRLFGKGQRKGSCKRRNVYGGLYHTDNGGLLCGGVY